MNKIDDLFAEVKASATASQEEQAIENVWKYVYENRLYVEINSISESGEKTDINDIADIGKVENVEVIFSKDDTEKSYRWNPVDNENIFILFREK